MIITKTHKRIAIGLWVLILVILLVGCGDAPVVDPEENPTPTYTQQTYKEMEYEFVTTPEGRTYDCIYNNGSGGVWCFPVRSSYVDQPYPGPTTFLSP